MESIDHAVFTVRNSVFPSNTYFLQQHGSEQCLLIDPGLDTAEIDRAITDLKLAPAAILVTHGHFDHIGGVSYFQKKYNIPYFLHQNDVKVAQSANFFLKLSKLSHRIDTPAPDVILREKYEEISIAGLNLQIYNLPGHSDGSCVIRAGNLVFTGDIIYEKKIGEVDFPGGNRDELKMSVKFILDNFTGLVIFPGHGRCFNLQESYRSKICD